MWEATRANATMPENAGFDINIGGHAQGHQPSCFATNKGGKGWRFKGVGLGHFDRFAQPYSESLRQNDEAWPPS